MSFDRLEGIYWYCRNHHNGQWSRLYRLQCRISRVYKPSSLHLGYASLSNESKEVYDSLVARNAA